MAVNDYFRKLLLNQTNNLGQDEEDDEMGYENYDPDFEDEDDFDDDEENYADDDVNDDENYDENEYDDNENESDEDDEQEKQDESDDDEEEGVLSELSQINEAKSAIKMNAHAFKKISKPVQGVKCPKCHQYSIYTEPALTQIAYKAAWGAAFLNRADRFVCFNPKCKMNYDKTHTRFKKNAIGDLVPTHWFHEVVNKNPFSFK